MCVALGSAPVASYLARAASPPGSTIVTSPRVYSTRPWRRRSWSAFPAASREALTHRASSCCESRTEVVSSGLVRSCSARSSSTPATRLVTSLVPSATRFRFAVRNRDERVRMNASAIDGAEHTKSRNAMGLMINASTSPSAITVAEWAPPSIAETAPTACPGCRTSSMISCPSHVYEVATARPLSRIITRSASSPSWNRVDPARYLRLVPKDSSNFHSESCNCETKSSPARSGPACATRPVSATSQDLVRRGRSRRGLRNTTSACPGRGSARGHHELMKNTPGVGCFGLRRAKVVTFECAVEGWVRHAVVCH